MSHTFNAKIAAISLLGVVSSASMASPMMASMMDVSAVMQNGVESRLSMAGPLFNGTQRLFKQGDPWVEAGWLHAKLDTANLSDEGKAGYKSNIGYGQVGYDHAIGDYRVGLSLLSGGGKIKGTGAEAGADSKTKYFGADLYATWTGKKVNVIANAGYLKGRNKLTVSDLEEDSSASLKMNTEAWFAEMKFETTFNVGAVNFVPYYSARFTHLSSNHVADAHFSDVNVWQFPAGFNAGLDFTCRAGWKTRFEFDAAVIASAGKRKTYVHQPDGGELSFRVADSIRYRTMVGLNTSKGQHAFGVKYAASFAPHGRFDQWVLANYQFMY